VGAFSGVENAKMRGSSPEMPKTGSPLATGELYMYRPFPFGRKFPLGRNSYVTAVAVGQRQRLYSGVRILTGYYLSFL
jgi:hypothetical protein